MKILLDENFPVALYRRLRLAGYDVEHIIVLGQRGLPDSAIRERLRVEELILLTQDVEFANIRGEYRGTIIISRVRQRLPIQRRTQIWLSAIERFLSERPAGKLLDLMETGELLAFETRDTE